MSAAPFAARLARAHEAMAIAGVDALLLSLGADLPWLSGYVAMPLERLTMLVVPAGGSSEQATLVVPALEAPRVTPVPEVFSVRPWGEMEDPVEIVASLVRRFTGTAPALAISDRAWATFLLQLERALPDAAWRTASTVTAPLRAIKDAAEVEALAKAAAAADRVAAALLGGEIALVQRTEREVSAEISRRLLEEGNEKVNFAIVGSGPNSASPHHEPSERVIQPREPVVCDFGGTLDGYCSDMTRTVFTGEPSRELAKIYGVVAKSQAAGVMAAQVGELCSGVDGVAGSSTKRVSASTSCTGPATASASRSMKIPIWSPATRRRSPQAMRSRSNRAFICRTAMGCASRTSWWPPCGGLGPSIWPITPSQLSRPDGHWAGPSGRAAPPGWAVPPGWAGPLVSPEF